MELHPEWKLIISQAWSIRFSLLAAFFETCEQLLPFFIQSLPPKIFATLSLISVIGAIVARVIAQPKTLPTTITPATGTSSVTLP